MQLSEKEALDMFIDLVKTGECSDDSLDVEHIHRGCPIERLSPNMFRFSVERHPHLFGKPSKGKASSAFATVLRSYELDTDTEEIEFAGEEVLDIEIDYYALAEQDVEDTWDAIKSDFDSKLEDLTSKDDVQEFAEIHFDEINWWFPYEGSEYELPVDFRENLKEALRKTFIDKVLDEWHFWR